MDGGDDAKFNGNHIIDQPMFHPQIDEPKKVCDYTLVGWFLITQGLVLPNLWSIGGV